jgi:hypothetical protein
MGTEVIAVREGSEDFGPADEKRDGVGRACAGDVQGGEGGGSEFLWYETS